MKKHFAYFILILMFFPVTVVFGASSVLDSLIGFQESPYFNEQVKTFSYYPDVKITINAPSKLMLNVSKRLKLIFFALPNGNTTAQTFGKKLQPGDDWHYDIQHIGAQTRFLRDVMKEFNIVTVYLENSQLSWPTWRSTYSNNPQIIRNMLDSVKSLFNQYAVDVILSGHSGGGSLIFGFLNGVDTIPNDIERITFLDSDYAYETVHGDKIAVWLNASDKHMLSVLAYNDSIALYNGAPIVSPTGGTWYRTKMMITRLKTYFTFTEDFTTDFQTYTALNGRIKIILKENPNRAILHTVQVELNGFIQTMSSGTPYEGVGYIYYGPRAYMQWVHTEITPPKIFAVVNDGAGRLRILLPSDANALSYTASLSRDGVTFSDTNTFAVDAPTLSNLPSDTICYVRLRMNGSFGSTVYSEVLAAVPSAKAHSVLIVNGFDRASTGNTYNFIRQHGTAFYANGFGFNSATNEAIIGGLISLRQYGTVDYILGDESTADETFSTAEQESVKTFLSNGGKLFVSGCEIAWDLDYKGSSTDKAFCSQYLKTQYVADNPGGTSGVGVYYRMEPVTGKIFDGLGVTSFDNGTHGTINVKYPDVITGVNGGLPCMFYTGFATSYSAVNFEGLFPAGVKTGKVVTMGIPFETIYPESSRTLVMKKITDYFAAPTSVQPQVAAPEQNELLQNYPNPFNPATTISFRIVNKGVVRLTIHDLLGRTVATLLDESREAGTHSVQWDATMVASGTYFYRIVSGNYSDTKRLLLLK